MIHTSIASLIAGRPLPATTPDADVRSACRLMCEHDVRAVVVIDEGRLAGVLSERDVIQQCVCPGRHTDEVRVDEIMTRDPRALDETDSLASALEVMAEGHFHHVPILRGDTPVGILSADQVPDEYRMLLERFKEIRGG
jgi:CBS domain-containing protein